MSTTMRASSSVTRPARRSGIDRKTDIALNRSRGSDLAMSAQFLGGVVNPLLSTKS